MFVCSTSLREESKMVLPELMCKIWDGDENEYFTWLDMNRVEYNANILARECGVAQVSFIEVTRASQFRYDEAQKLENLLKAVADKRGKTITIESAWGAGRTVSYVDFERWEANFWTLYTDMGGTGHRIPAGKVLVTYNATLFASAWQGSGPYYQDLEMPAVYPATDAVAYVDHTATVEQRMAEYNALIQAAHQGDRKIRAYAHSIRPTADLPIKITLGGFRMLEKITLSANAWQGSGPWTQDVNLSSIPVDAIIGSDERNSTTQMQAFAEAIIGVSAVSGTTVTIRAIGTKPSEDVYASIAWNQEV